MKYKNAIISIIIIILILAIAVIFWTQQKIDSDKTSWNSNLLTSVFRPQLIAEAERGSSSFIRLTWQKPETTYNHFLITVTNPQTDWSRTESGEHERVSLDVSDLEPDTTYTFSVRACGDPDCKTWITSNEKPRARTEKMYWKFVETKFSDSLPIKEGWESNIDLERSVFLTIDNKLWTENKDDWQIANVYVQSKPTYKIVLKLISSVEDEKEKTLFAELLNP
ncbi:fibronectin type III domain-containing protein [Candidatus Uhrbacteria bacterium]|nr:fibronectin type III domain-containing protein [Candidatus Uhrbacteria bacterium]